jgi:hypothetical protein|tara:strand:+ start:151 stop:477 length:327 start_codon:yes stop_codon:yes gene_type:complete
MSHFAEINKDGIVQQVIVAEQDYINSGLVGDSFNWIQVSYNGSFRKKYAGIGYKYDKTKEIFIEPQPYPSWTLNENSDWQPPTPFPDDEEAYYWNEDNTSWESSKPPE